MSKLKNNENTGMYKIHEKGPNDFSNDTIFSYLDEVDFSPSEEKNLNFQIRDEEDPGCFGFIKHLIGQLFYTQDN